MTSLLLLFFACSPYADLEDRWTEAVEICDPPVPFVRSVTELTPLTEACRDRLVEDFGVADTFEVPEVREWLIEALFNLLGRDQGRVSELVVSDYVREPFIERTRAQAEALGTDDVAATLYSFSANEISTIVDSNGEKQGFEYNAETGLMRVNMGWYVADIPDRPHGPTWATSVVHEATHAVVMPHVACEGTDDLDCDVDWSGAYGAQLAVAELMLESCDAWADGYNCGILDSLFGAHRWRIAAD